MKILLEIFLTNRKNNILLWLYPYRLCEVKSALFNLLTYYSERIAFFLVARNISRVYYAKLATFKPP